MDEDRGGGVGERMKIITLKPRETKQWRARENEAGIHLRAISEPYHEIYCAVNVLLLLPLPLSPSFSFEKKQE